MGWGWQSYVMEVNPVYLESVTSQMLNMEATWSLGETLD